MAIVEVKQGGVAFDLDRYKEGISYRELRDDIVSYLGEYRLKVQKYNYNFIFSADNSGRPKLRDSYRNEPMSLKTQRAIGERKLRGEPTYREEAELAGILRLEEQLLSSETNDTVLWASPPGPKEEGYGDYGFIYFGKIVKEGDKKNLSMAAIRVENPSISDFNKALKSLIGQKPDFKVVEEFLSSPFILNKDIDEQTLNRILVQCFSFKEDKEQEDKFKRIIQRLDGMIGGFINMVKNGEGRLKAFNAIENYALKLKKEYEAFPWENVVYDRNRRLDDIVGEYGYKPPKVAGSCGNSSGIKSNNTFSFDFDGLNAIFDGLFEEDKWFVCPKCHYKADGPIGDKCPGCGITKKEYAKESSEPVCD